MPRDERSRPDLDAVAREDGRYPVEGFAFVGQALGHAVQLYRPAEATGTARHLTAGELLQGAVDLAASRYGMLGDLVLQSWGIRRNEDIGEITFALIARGVFTKQPEDRIEDFTGHAPLADALRGSVRQRLGLDN
jgi:uncharacterized repeat protein (TIGR04138 family)